MATLHTLTEQEVIAVSEAGQEPTWLLDRRLEAYKAFADLEWPTNRVEEWRYTDPRRFDLTRPLVEGGRVAADTSAQGVVISDLATAARSHEALVRDALGTAVGVGRKFAAANLAAFTEGVFVHVPAELELDEPIRLTVEAAADGTQVPRVLVVLGAHAQATVLLDHVGDTDTTVVEVVEAVLREGASLQLVTTQHWGPRVDHLGAHTGRVGANADYHHFEATLGGKTVYLTPDVKLAEPGGNAELLGVYLTEDGRHVEHRSLIHHDASNTTSDSIYKGALQGDSFASWYGNIRIEPHAKATASDETNRNLILGAGARASSIPFLEILCSDVVRCGHHSSVGQMDELQLFYLESRGIPREQAVRMLVFGFFKEVTDRVGVPAVAEGVLAELQRAIEGSYA